MNYINNWDKIKRRMGAFWNNEIIDRCMVYVTAPKKDSKYKPEPLPDDPIERMKFGTDPERILKRNIARFENTYFAGDAFPVYFLYLGSAGHSGFFKGARYEFQGTVWFFPTIEKWGKDKLEFDPDSFLYKKTIEIAKYLVDESKGSFIVSMPDNTGYADALAQLRGTEELLVDMITDKDNVHYAMKKIEEVWYKTTEEIYQITKDNNDGGSSVGWLRTWAPGRHTQVQCDMSVMISPETFKEFIRPEIVSQCNWMNRSLYHFDGMEQIRHLDMMLSIDNLHAIQWTPVKGQPPVLDFIPVLKKIQATGKGLIIKTERHELEPLMEQLSSKGLYLLMDAESEEEARDIVKTVEKLTHE